MSAPRPLLPGFYRVVPMGADRMQLRTAGRVLRVSGPGLGDLAARVVPHLDGRSTVTEIAARLSLDPAAVEGLVASLAGQGLLADPDQVPGAADTPAEETYAELGGRPGRVQAAIAAARVVLVGTGVLPRLIGAHLAATGTGELVVVAGPATEDGDGAAPAASLEEVLHAGRADLVVVEGDELGSGEPANAVCLATGTTALWYSASAAGATVGPAVPAAGRPCHRCVVLRRAGHLRHFEEYTAFRQALQDKTVAARPPGLVDPWASVVGGLVSLEALRLIGGLPPVTAGAVLTADARTLEVRREEVLAVPGCPACDRGDEHLDVAPSRVSRR